MTKEISQSAGVEPGKRIIETNTHSDGTKRYHLIRRLLSNLNQEVENLVAIREQKKPIPAPRKKRKPVSVDTNAFISATQKTFSRASEKRKTLVDEYENNIIPLPIEFSDIIEPPIQFRDRPIPAPRLKKKLPLLLLRQGI